MLIGHLPIQRFNKNGLNTYHVLSAENIANTLYKAVIYTLNDLFQNTRKLTTEL